MHGPANTWYTQKAGLELFTAEQSELDEILPRLFGYHLVLLGEAGFSSLVSSSLISHRTLVNPSDVTAWPCSLLRGHFTALPIDNDSVDVVVLAHLLERVKNPHQVLREAHRILRPEGYIVITGFNPLSLWGAQHFFESGDREGHYLKSRRVKDWLKLLNFHIVGGKTFFFKPPVGSANFRRRLQFLERWGQRWWPFMGAAYTILAVKRELQLTPLRPRWHRKQALWTNRREPV